MVLEPGDNRLGDYWKLELPLLALFAVLVPAFWPLPRPGRRHARRHRTVERAAPPPRPPAAAGRRTGACDPNARHAPPHAGGSGLVAAGRPVTLAVLPPRGTRLAVWSREHRR